MRQIYRTDIVQKPTRPAGTSECGTPTSFTPQENGDHVYTTNTGFEMTKPRDWRVEDPRGFVRPLGGSGIIAPATPAGAASTPIARAASIIDVSPALGVILAGATGVTFTAILRQAFLTTSTALNVGNVSTTMDVGLIAPPVPAVQSPTPIAEPIGDLAELTPIVTGVNIEETNAPTTFLPAWEQQLKISARGREHRKIQESVCPKFFPGPSRANPREAVTGNRR